MSFHSDMQIGDTFDPPEFVLTADGNCSCLWPEKNSLKYSLFLLSNENVLNQMLFSWVFLL